MKTVPKVEQPCSTNQLRAFCCPRHWLADAPDCSLPEPVELSLLHLAYAVALQGVGEMNITAPEPEPHFGTNTEQTFARRPRLA